MTTVLEQTQTVKPGFWSLRDRMKVLNNATPDGTVADAVIGILDDMYLAHDEERCMLEKLQTPVGYGLGLIMAGLIDKIPSSDPRRSEQVLKLINCIQTPEYGHDLYPIDRASIEPVNKAISLLDINDPARTYEILAHIERIVTDPHSTRAKSDAYYYGNHGYLYYPNRANGVAESVALLPEGDIKAEAAISHLRYLANEAVSMGGEFPVRYDRLRTLIQSMLECIPEDQHGTVIEVIAQPQLGETLEAYDSGRVSAAKSVSRLSALLALLPEGRLDPEDSGLLTSSMAFAEAAQNNHPAMLKPDDKPRAFSSSWQLAGLWREVALRTQAGEIANGNVTATSQTVKFHRQGRSFDFAGSN